MDNEPRFEWDDRKAKSNLAKHGVSFWEAASVLSDPLAVEIHDPSHSTDEERYVMIGKSDRGNTLVVAHTERGAKVRIISARKATRQELRAYEEGADQVKDDDMLPEYDFSGGVRGKHAKQFSRDRIAVLLDKDVAKVFRTSGQVNEALRKLVRSRRARAKRLAS